MFKFKSLSNFKKLFIVLIFILILEILIIYLGHKNCSKVNSNSIKNYDPKNPIVLIVDITDNVLTVLQKGKILKTYTIAGGKPSTPSPIGTWTIISKDTWGEGFGGRWMGLNVPWGKYGIHGTNKPNSIGWNSSHGCIRMKNKDITELYKITKHGTKVIIWGGPYGNLGQSLRILKPGMRGSDVYEVQRILKYKGYYKAHPDGIYGEYLRNVVHKFQKDNSIKITDTIGYTFYKKLGIELME